MKRTIFILLISILVSYILMSGGYGAWERTLIIDVSIEVPKEVEDDKVKKELKDASKGQDIIEEGKDDGNEGDTNSDVPEESIPVETPGEPGTIVENPKVILEENNDNVMPTNPPILDSAPVLDDPVDAITLPIEPVDNNALGIETGLTNDEIINSNND